MLKCNEVTRLIASDELETAPWRTRLSVRFHLLMCRHCRRYVAQLRDIGQATRRLFRAGGNEKAEGEAVERIKRSVLGDEGNTGR